MTLLELFLKAVSPYVDTEDESFQALIGDTSVAIPDPSVVTVSSDIGCGALCNELEYVRMVSDYYVDSISIDGAEDDNLTSLITAMIDLERMNDTEPDDNYRKRFKTITIQKSYPRRTTKWAIQSALSYFTELTKIQVVEFFETSNLYFQVRLEGVNNYTDCIFIDQGFIDQDFIGGVGIGSLITFVDELISRIKAAGVDFDTIIIIQNSISILSDAEIA